MYRFILSLIIIVCFFCPVVASNNKSQFWDCYSDLVYGEDPAYFSCPGSIYDTRLYYLYYHPTPWTIAWDSSYVVAYGQCGIEKVCYDGNTFNVESFPYWGSGWTIETSYSNSNMVFGTTVIPVYDGHLNIETGSCPPGSAITQYAYNYTYTGYPARDKYFYYECEIF